MSSVTYRHSSTSTVYTSKQTKEDIKQNDSKKDKLRFTLPIKQFEKRRNMLTEICEDNMHLRAVYNIVCGVSIFSMISVNITQYNNHERFSPAFDVIYEKFGKFYYVFLIWIATNIHTLLCYFAFLLWGKIRQKMQLTIVDRFFILLIIFYYGLIFYGITRIVHYLELPFASSAIIMCESTRLLMKTYAFVRTNVPKILLTKSSNRNLAFPTLSQYVLFLYAPTCIYRDDYPRTEKIRWNFVFMRICELIWCILCMAHIYVHLIIPIFKDICIKPVTLLGFSILLIQIGVPALLLLLLINFSCLHATQEAVGELVRFGDRMTIADWWNSSDMQTFYKKWNMAVGDWLYTYVHKEVVENVFPGNYNLAKLVTITLSAAFHEWILTVACGFFCPITTVMMMISVVFMSFSKRKTYMPTLNMIYWFLLPIGPGMIALFFFVENFARYNFHENDLPISVFWNHCIVY